MTESEIVAKAIEVDPATVQLIAAPGMMQSGAEVVALLAALGHKVKFLRWPGGIGGAVAYLDTRSEPTRQQIVQAFRDAVQVDCVAVRRGGAGHA
jgi:hypothetical protein